MPAVVTTSAGSGVVRCEARLLFACVVERVNAALWSIARAAADVVVDRCPTEKAGVTKGPANSLQRPHPQGQTRKAPERTRMRRSSARADRATARTSQW